ncbi:hypothetical protein SBV1_120013 [Verrucomicrobia bacterium]|nr:hypothetical protein SBV1_120013 [Verrucomicrobiota bacterium]
MKITVTKEDIDGGRRSDPEDCPVARALRRAGLAHFGVTGMAVMVGGEPLHTTLLLPGAVQEWIMDYDWGAPVKPMEFELVLPSEGTELPPRPEAVAQPALAPESVAEALALPILDLEGPKSEPEPVELFVYE